MIWRETWDFSWMQSLFKSSCCSCRTTIFFLWACQATFSVKKIIISKTILKKICENLFNLVFWKMFFFSNNKRQLLFLRKTQTFLIRIPKIIINQSTMENIIANFFYTNIQHWDLTRTFFTNVCCWCHQQILLSLLPMFKQPFLIESFRIKAII